MVKHREWTELMKKSQDRMSHFFINIGGNDGKTDDPIYPLIEKEPSIGGIVIEPNPVYWSDLKKNLGTFENIYIEHEGISVSNAIELVKGPVALKQNAHYPTNDRTVDIFKFDIDSCECHILEEMMKDKFYHAKVIQIELNHVIPPPISYRDMCYNGAHGRSGEKQIWGCSAQADIDCPEQWGIRAICYPESCVGRSRLPLHSRRLRHTAHWRGLG